MNVIMECLSNSTSYVQKRKEDIEFITRIIKNNPKVQITHAKTDNWIVINNTIVNAITRKDINEIYKSLNINMPEEGGQ